MKSNILIISLVIELIFLFNACKKASNSNNGNLSLKILYTSYVVDSLYFHSDTILYDVNQDNINDIKLIMYFNASGDTMNYGGKIIGINSNMMFCDYRRYPYMAYLKLNDEINNDTINNWGGNYYYSGRHISNSYNANWTLETNPKYFGFSFTKNNRIYYGWVHLKYFEINEIGFNELPNSSILVGQK